MVENGSIDPISLVEFLEDSNTLLFETPVIGAEYIFPRILVLAGKK